MSKTAKKFAKKKAREAKVKIKLAKLREIKHKKDKLENEQNLELKRFEKDQREMERLQNFIDEVCEKIPEETAQKLKNAMTIPEHLTPEIAEKIAKNIEILKVLEKEYRNEIKNREKLNQEMEEKGLKTFKEKLGYLNQMQNADQGVGGTAEVSFQANSPED